jgi:hypothetical protein
LEIPQNQTYVPLDNVSTKTFCAKRFFLPCVVEVAAAHIHTEIRRTELEIFDTHHKTMVVVVVVDIRHHYYYYLLLFPNTVWWEDLEHNNPTGTVVAVDIDSPIPVVVPHTGVVEFAIYWKMRVVVEMVPTRPNRNWYYPQYWDDDDDTVVVAIVPTTRFFPSRDTTSADNCCSFEEDTRRMVVVVDTFLCALLHIRMMWLG